MVVNPTVSRREKPENVDLYDGYSFIGLGSDGAFAEFTNAPETNVYHLPDNVSAREVSRTNSSCCPRVKEGELLFGDTVAVFGAGPIGLLTIVAAKAAGASKIFVFDLSEERLAKAKSVGATHVYNSGNVDPVQTVYEHTDNGVDVSFEVAGVGITLQQSIEVTRPRGTAVIVSIFGHPVEFNPLLQMNKGVKLTTTIAYTPTTFQQTIDLIANGSLNVKDVVTDQIELENIVESGFNQLVNDKSQAKILVRLNGDQK